LSFKTVLTTDHRLLNQREYSILFIAHLKNAIKSPLAESEFRGSCA
jgi:hypothetical protein